MWASLELWYEHVLSRRLLLLASSAEECLNHLCLGTGIATLLTKPLDLPRFVFLPRPLFVIIISIKNICAFRAITAAYIIVWTAESAWHTGLVQAFDRAWDTSMAKQQCTTLNRKPPILPESGLSHLRLTEANSPDRTRQLTNISVSNRHIPFLLRERSILTCAVLREWLPRLQCAH